MFRKTLFILAVISFAGTCPQPAAGGWMDILDRAAGTGSSGSSPGGLTQTEMAGGLRQALEQGIRNAVSSLGQKDGFMGNPAVRIPMPEKLEAVESMARSIGQDQLADEFILSMNRAGEQAVPETLEVLTGAVQNMTLEEARSILQGPEDAATRHFERTSRPELAERIRPIVEQATSSAGVTSRYKSLVGTAAPLTSLTGGRADLDLDSYVTDRTLDGVFLLMAREEKRIRENPAARTTELLQKVFSR